jgi:hypothetical protein
MSRHRTRLAGLPCPKCSSVVSAHAPQIDSVGVCLSCDAVLELVAGQIRVIEERELEAFGVSVKRAIAEVLQSLECGGCRTILAFEGDRCGLCYPDNPAETDQAAQFRDNIDQAELDYWLDPARWIEIAADAEDELLG